MIWDENTNLHKEWKVLELAIILINIKGYIYDYLISFKENEPREWEDKSTDTSQKKFTDDK